jgi:hypothetical protein
MAAARVVGSVESQLSRLETRLAVSAAHRHNEDIYTLMNFHLSLCGGYCGSPFLCNADINFLMKGLLHYIYFFIFYLKYNIILLCYYE